MFLGNGRHPSHSHSPNASAANRNQDFRHVWPRRSMGPPQLNHPPQPVEIDPVSYPRVPGSYTPWEGAASSVGYVGESSTALSNSLGHNKSGPVSLDSGARNSPQDPLTSWYTGNDGPWIPKGAFPEVPQDERMHPRGYAHAPYRNPGYCSSPEIRQGPGNLSENGSVHFGISPSDSGYGTGVSLESASVRGSDIVDHSQENRSILGRVPEVHQYHQRRSTRESHGTESWPYSSLSATLHRCPTCHTLVKTKSELKKHHLRHTKPFRCTNPSCSRAGGFSTVNDLNRHKKSKHPGDLSGEVRSKTYHCLVSGCKSQEKIWPRLDNFRSHLKRVHHLPDDTMDHFVHSGEMDQRTNGGLPSQGNSSASPGTLDQDIPLGLGSEDFPELSYPGDHPQWSNVSSSPLDRQTEITDPLLGNADTQSLVPPNGDSLIGLGDDPGKPTSPLGSRASWESGAGNGCLEKRKEMTSADAISEGIAVPITDSLGSSVGTLDSADTLDRGKAPKPKKASTIDPFLRNALITAVFCTANPGNDDGSHPEINRPPGIRLPDVAHVPDISPCRMDSRIALPGHAAATGKHPDDQDLCSKASSASTTDARDLTDQDAKIQKLLQVIKDAGYVLKKENKPHTGLGQNVNNLASGSQTKRDPVWCSLCEFHGRPCELRKHIKRHTRPYGCTFPKCQKTFGSKNDWKRHEISQHYQHETWRCDEKTDGASCTKVFSSVDNARAHFTKIHNVTDPEVLGQKIEARRIGSNNQAQFWCGFCESVIDLAQKGIDAWLERFNHIDDHFMGKNGQSRQRIAQWRAADNDDKGVQQNASAQSRSPSEGDETSEDSSPSSSDNSSSSPDTLIMPTSSEIIPAQQKRKREDSDERGGRSKQPRYGKYEYRIQCCQCGLHLNPKIDTACPSDGHDFCDGCQRRKIYVQKDTAK